MKRFILLLSVPAIIAAFAGCSKSGSSAPTTSNVMFVNGCAGTVNTDVSVNNTKLSAASNLAFLRNSGYLAVTASSNVNFAISLTATGTPLVNGTEPLVVGTDYSLFTGGLVTSSFAVLTNDDLTAPPAGMAKVRFANLSSDSLNLTCSIGSQTLDSNVAIGHITPFFTIAAVTGASVLCQDPSPANHTKISTLSAQNYVAGKIYTIMLTGTSSGTLTSVLTLTTIGNN
jgi:hypothetical protein